MSDVKDSKEGVKHDQGKLRYDLEPPEAREEVIKVYTFGATKYADRNWEKGIKFSRNIAAAERHLAEFKKGNMMDPETKTNHLANAIVNLSMMLQFVLTQQHVEKGLDDLPNSTLRLLSGPPLVPAGTPLGETPQVKVPDLGEKV